MNGAADDASGLLKATVASPLPPGLTGQIVTTADGMLLRCATLRPPVARGTVMLLQGRGEFIERYYETINDVVARGFAVVTFDWRGQGGSTRLTRDGRRGHVGSFAEYDTDLETVAEQLMLPDLPPPYLGLALSTGGQVMLRALDRHGWFAGAMLLAPFLGLGAAPLPQPVVKVLAPALTMAGFGKVYAFGQGRARSFLERRFDGNRLTSDERRYQRSASVVASFPELGTGAPTIGWLSAALASIRRLERRGVRGKSAPVLIVAAGRDQVVSTTNARAFAHRHSSAIAVIPGARHELLQERDVFRDQVFAAFDIFVEPLVDPRAVA